jgi:hypothetical protein
VSISTYPLLSKRLNSPIIKTQENEKNDEILNLVDSNSHLLKVLLAQVDG